MSDFQRVVEFLRDFRTSPIQTVTDEVRTAATEYAELCTAANERLRQCAVLLQRGLRAEAINLAEASPNLLDLVTALDLPAADRWAEFCQREDLPVPPQLQIERASLLNDAYGQEQPLEALYAKHRRLALAQAPIQKRLAVMRQIAQVDPSPFWDKDVRVFEYARFKELRVSFASAVRDKDMKTITALSQELLESPWLDPVPPDLQAAARDVSDRLRLVQFDSAIRELEAQLQAAYAAKSTEQCSALLDKVNELMGAYGVSELPGESSKLVEKARKWVKQQEEARAARAAFEASCDALTAAIDADAPNSELEALLQAVRSHGRPVPNELQQRYDGTLKRRSSAAVRRLVLVLVLVAAVAGIGAVVGTSILRARAETRWAQRIHSAAVAPDLALAKKIIEDQEREAPKFSTATDVAAARREVDVLQQKADTDTVTLRSALSSMLAVAQKADAAAKAEEAAADNPSSTASLDNLRDAGAAISDALARRSQLPDLKWVDPRNSLAMATKDLEARRADLKERYDRGVLARVRAVADRAEQLDPDASSPASDALVAGIDHDLSGLRGYIQSGSEAATAADAVSGKITSYQDTIKKRQAYAQALKELPADITDATLARDKLTEFTSKFPTAPVTKDILKALGSVDLYKSVEIWHLTSGPWVTDPSPASDKVAQQRLDQIRGFLRDFPGSPDAPRANAYADYLQQAIDAMAVQNTWQTSMNDVLTSPLISDLKFVQTTDGRRYYVMGPLNARKTELNDRITYTFDSLDPQNLTHKRQITLLPPNTLTNETPQPMPHAVFTQALAEQLKTVDHSNWDTFGIDLAAQIAGAQQIDQVVKAILLRDAVTATDKSISWAGIDAYEKPASDLARQKLDQVVWYDTEHPVAPALIGNLTRIFNEIPKAADVKKLLADHKAELFKTLRPKFGGYGLLLRDDAGKWTVRTRGVPASGATAVVIIPTPGHAAASTPAASQPADAGPPTSAPAVDSSKFVTVAEWKNGVWIVDDSAVTDLPQGTLLLIAKP